MLHIVMLDCDRIVFIAQSGSRLFRNRRPVYIFDDVCAVCVCM